MRNEGPTGNAVALDLTGKAPNLDAVGAIVKATIGGATQVQMVRTGSSYLSHSPLMLTFGLGDVEGINRLEIRWPDGVEEVLNDVAAGARYDVVQGHGIVRQQAFMR